MRRQLNYCFTRLFSIRYSRNCFTNPSLNDKPIGKKAAILFVVHKPANALCRQFLLTFSVKEFKTIKSIVDDDFSDIWQGK